MPVKVKVQTEGNFQKEMSLISDGELRRQLRSYGVDVGPINDSTRNLYQKKLRTLTGKAQQRSPAPLTGVKRRRGPVTSTNQGNASKRPRVEESPPKQTKKKAVLYPDLSEWLPGDNGSEVIPGARPLFSPASHPINNRATSKPSSEVIPGITRYPSSRPLYSPSSHPANEQRSSSPISSSQIIPGAQGELGSLHSRVPYPAARGSSKHIPPHPRRISAVATTPKPLRSPASGASPAELQLVPQPSVHGSSNSLHHGALPHSSSDESSSLSPVGSDHSLSPPSPRPPFERSPSGASSPSSLPRMPRFLGTVTKFIGSQVKQLFNKAEPRHSIKSSPSRQGHSPSRRSLPANSEPLHEGPQGPVEEELDFEDDFEIAEVTSSESLEGSIKYDWELQSSDVAICRRSDGTPWSLGKGGFGEVFKGLRDGVDEVAVKVIRISNCTPTVIAQFKAEIDLISKLRHRNIVQFYGACIHPQDLYMVTELMSNDLFSVLRLPREAEKYKWSGVYGRDVLIGVASGLNYLHSRSPPVVHRDVKSPNILVMEGVAKLADVGVARTMRRDVPDMTAQRGFTIAWAAPEVVYRRRATEKIDIWSLGVIMWEVVSGKLPRPGTLVLPAASPQSLRVLYSRCMSDNPVGRPSALEVVTKLRNIRE